MVLLGVAFWHSQLFYIIIPWYFLTNLSDAQGDIFELKEVILKISIKNVFHSMQTRTHTKFRLKQFTYRTITHSNKHHNWINLVWQCTCTLVSCCSLSKWPVSFTLVLWSEVTSAILHSDVRLSSTTVTLNSSLTASSEVAMESAFVLSDFWFTITLSPLFKKFCRQKSILHSLTCSSPFWEMPFALTLDKLHFF